jgi:hypothetical protein
MIFTEDECLCSEVKSNFRIVGNSDVSSPLRQPKHSCTVDFEKLDSLERGRILCVSFGGSIFAMWLDRKLE